MRCGVANAAFRMLTSDMPFATTVWGQLLERVSRIWEAEAGDVPGADTAGG